MISSYIDFKKKQFNDDIQNTTHYRIKPQRKSQNRVRIAATPPPLPTATSSPPLLCQPVTNEHMKKEWKRGPRKKCCFVKCPHTERTDPNIKMVPNLPKNQPPLETGRFRDVERFVKKKLRDRQY